MKKLTCNQAMVLLDIYRGTYNKDRHMGTYPVDLQMLEAEGLVKSGFGYSLSPTVVWEVTSAGGKRVKEMLG